MHKNAVVEVLSVDCLSFNNRVNIPSTPKAHADGTVISRKGILLLLLPYLVLWFLFTGSLSTTLDLWS